MSRPMTIVMMWMKNPIRGGEGDQHPVLSQRREVPNVRYHTRPEDAVSRIQDMTHLVDLDGDLTFEDVEQFVLVVMKVFGWSALSKGTRRHENGILQHEQSALARRCGHLNGCRPIRVGCVTS
jgi:hypothetical protein